MFVFTWATLISFSLNWVTIGFYIGHRAASKRNDDKGGAE